MASERAVACARAALTVWNRDTVIMMTAIAGAESGWNPITGGDSPAQLQAAGYVGNAVIASAFNCPSTWNGHASWGLWQIFMPVHKEMLKAIGAPVDGGPCQTAIWLQDPMNNAKAAERVWRSQGYAAWTVFKTQAYLRYMDEAREAVAIAEKGEREPPPGGVVRAASPFLLLLGLGSLGLLKWLKK